MTDELYVKKQAELDAIRWEIEAELQRQALAPPDVRRLRNARRLTLERELAEMRQEEFAEPVEMPYVVGDEWYLMASFSLEAPLICGDVGDDYVSVVVFQRPAEIRFGGLNDEVFESHPLYGKGLDIFGLFAVRNSVWKREIEAGNAVHPSDKPADWTSMRHYILRGKGGRGCVLGAGCPLRAVRGEHSCLARKGELLLEGVRIAFRVARPVSMGNHDQGS